MTVTDAQRADVVRRAYTQLGKPYKWLGEGPNSYDCSGSAVDAWRPYLTLPHNSSAQVTDLNVRTVAAGSDNGAALIDSAGRSAAVKGHGELNWAGHWIRFGDLVFYYGDVRLPDTISHVALYVGGGLVINATGIVDGKNRGVELIGINQYAVRVGYGYVAH